MLCVCLSALLTIVQFIMVFRSSFIKICLECHGNLSILSMHNLSLVVWVFSEVVQARFQLYLRRAFCILCCACKKSMISILTQTSEWLLSFYSKHFIFRDEISPYDLKFLTHIKHKLYFMHSFPSHKVFFWNSFSVPVTWFFIKPVRKCPYLLNSLTSWAKRELFILLHPPSKPGWIFFFCTIKSELMKSLNGVCAVVLNLCYNQLKIGSISSCTFLLGCSLPIYENRWFQALISYHMPSEHQLILHLFLCHNDTSSTQILFLGLFFLMRLFQVTSGCL